MQILTAMLIQAVRLLDIAHDACWAHVMGRGAIAVMLRLNHVDTQAGASKNEAVCSLIRSSEIVIGKNCLISCTLLLLTADVLLMQH